MAAVLQVTAWHDPVVDAHGMHPCSRYVELYWLGVLGPSTTWLLRRVTYGLEVHETGFALDLVETACSLGLGGRLGPNSSFRRALRRLVTFELARPSGPSGLAVRTRVPPLPLRHLQRLPVSLQRSHQRYLEEQLLDDVERSRRRATRLAAGLAASGQDARAIEAALARWQFHPAVAYQVARDVLGGGGVAAAVPARTGDASTGDARTGDARTGDASTGDASTGDASQDGTAALGGGLYPDGPRPVLRVPR
ncbi:MAG: hypothetical protein ACP5P9_01960 [Acidimicrobiales bacterium]